MASTKCVHIARPGGSDSRVNFMKQYARTHRWTELLTVPTAGYIGRGSCNGVCVVSQRIDNVGRPGGKIRTILLMLDNQNLIVGKEEKTEIVI